ncbi:Fe-Mn family superoxide dismutase [Candidatus Woesearchaeota archaeon]|nr:Fe-Mn family superoxide dismutase [Candidatus Woesearchaeota archaeon]
MTAYEPKNYEHLLGLAGFSDILLKNHFTLYQGYVTNTNKLRDILATLVKESKISTPEFAELTRRFGWEFNGMRLHELYFGNLNKTALKLDHNSHLAKNIIATWGSIETWEKELRGICAMRGIGWGVLYYDLSTGKLFNTWINEHDVGHLTTCAPLLIVDVFEHAFMVDYGLKRADYLEAVFKAIDYKEVERRYGVVGGK